MTVELSPSGAQTSDSVQVQNITDRPVRLEARVERRVANGDGSLSSVVDEDNFLVFPPTATLAAGATQSFRIQWIGTPTLAQSESYYLYVKTVSDAQFTSSGFSIAYQFGVAVHVSPRDAKPLVRGAGAVPGRTADGGSAIVFKVQNDGRRYARLAEHDLSLKYLSGGKSISVSPADINSAIGSGFVLPGSVREFRVPVAAVPDADSEITVSLSAEPRPQ